tara:strand:+ start:449 stop:667 length:219 start_codon:yes stop_codon:yes gene_type:complete
VKTMGTSWTKRHRHETDEYQKAEKARYMKWKAEHKKKFPTSEEFLKHIREKYGWPKYNKYQRNAISQGEKDE